MARVETRIPGAGIDLAYGPHGLVVATVVGAHVRFQSPSSTWTTPDAPRALLARTLRVAVSDDGEVACICQVTNPDRAVLYLRGAWSVLPYSLWGQAPVGIASVGHRFVWAVVTDKGGELRAIDEDGVANVTTIPGGTSQGILQWDGVRFVLADERKDVGVAGLRLFHATQRAGWTVGEAGAPDRVVVANAEGYSHVLTVGNPSTPRLAVSGPTVSVAYSQDNAPTLVTLTPPYPVDPPEPIPVIGRRMFCGFFEFTPASLPGNCELVQVSTWEWRLMSGGFKRAVYVSGEPDGDLSSLERNIAKVKSQGVPVWAYWPRKLQVGRLPRGADVTAVEGYRLASETAHQYETGLLASVKRCGPAAVIGQAFTSNPTLTKDLASIPPVIGRVARDCENVVAVIGFSGSGRPTGLQDHPAVRSLWAELAAGIPGPPKPEPAKPPTPPKPPVTPPVTPVPTEPPVPQLTLRAHDGHFVCAEPDGSIVANREAIGSWETFDMVPGVDGRIALKSAHAKFVCAEGGGGGVLVANRDSVGPWESFRRHSADGGFALETWDGHFVCAEGGGGREVNATRTAAGPWETFGAGAAHGGGGSAAVRGPITVAGRSFMNDAGIFRPLFVSSFGTLSQLIHGDDAAAAAYMDWAKATGFNGLRFFAGNLTWQNQKAGDALRVLPRALQLAKDRGLYVSVTALTDTGAGGFDKAAHVKACGQAAGAAGNAILEVANEPWHPSQDSDTHDAKKLKQWATGSPVPFALGAAELDELTKPCGEGGTYPMAGGTWIQIHLRRSQEWPIQFARVREQEAVSGCLGVPVMNGEPLAWNETEQAGRRLNVPEAFYMLGAFTRVMECGLIGHGEHALRSQIPGPVQQQCAEALIAGVRDVDAIIGTDQRCTLKNGHWADAPATGRFVDEGNREDLRTKDRVWRVTSGLVGNKAAVILGGVNGDPGLRFQAGWREVRQVSSMARVRLYEAAR